MSDANNPEPAETPEPAKTTDSTQPPSKPEKKSRSPVERAVVWGLIVILLVVLGIEALADRSYKNAFKNMEQLMDEVSAATQQDGDAVTKTNVTEAVGGKKPLASESTPATNTKGKTDVYVWRGVLKKRKLYVHYGVEMANEEPKLSWFSAEQPDQEASATSQALKSVPDKAESKQEPGESEP